MVEPQEFTDLVRRGSDGDRNAIDRLYLLIEPVLRQYARRQKAKMPGVDVETTQLMNDAILNVLGRRMIWEEGDSRRFYDLASRKMLDLLVNDKREQNAKRRGGGLEHLPIEAADLNVKAPLPTSPIDALGDVCEALEGIQADDRDAAVVFRMKFALALTFKEIGLILGVPTDRAYQAYVRAVDRLKRSLGDERITAAGPA